jgi:large subunit ribosomal protein L10
MVRSIALFLATLAAASAFTSAPLPQQHHLSLQQRQLSTETALFGGASGYATSKAGKADKITRIKELLESSQMIFAVPASSITVAQGQRLRRSMPEGTTITVVKNTLMERAVEGTEYQSATSLLTGANMWFFVEDDIGASIKAWNAFTKETQKKDTHSLLGGVIESTLYDGAGVALIGELPSKDEMYARIAGSIKAIPTKVARVIKAPSSKLARAIKLAAETKE